MKQAPWTFYWLEETNVHQPYKKNNKLHENDKKEWVSKAISNRFIKLMYVLDTVYNDCKSMLIYGLALPGQQVYQENIFV